MTAAPTIVGIRLLANASQATRRNEPAVATVDVRIGAVTIHGVTLAHRRRGGPPIVRMPYDRRGDRVVSVDDHDFRRAIADAAVRAYESILGGGG